MDDERKKVLLETLEKLSPTDQSAVASFAEFLLGREPGFSFPAQGSTDPVRDEPVEIPEPEHIQAPENERVVAALKRLSKTYPMLGKNKMLGVTSDLMTQHVLHGREASEVIAELERVFQEAYETLKQDSD
ncbi:hypothetical protein DFR30_0640 [Thiogranum longum]|uniref:Crp/Fnr family transcriptional regulator n=1 Tax=Thiogranum longum TaxID=1537524 RepID=A0A4R1HB73_9GAMM|nr:Crp/Fnr family transcriptional regulator [Thiogranum longum]TCK17410.1 hypothetical protein DFR30_0640 [Thiogranum longum]